MKDIFFATLSHELRTPLTAIMGWVHILKEGQNSPDLIRRAVETIERNLNVQNRLIADLLDVSRIVSGKLDMEMAALDFPAVVRALVDSARPTATANGVELEVVLSPIDAPISGDPTRLQQVVTNLLTNSLKFTPRGGSVVVRLAREGSRAVLTVTDSGSGIKAEALPYVFERFRQASIADTKAGGLGLGLAIVKHIVEMHKARWPLPAPAPERARVHGEPAPEARHPDRRRGRGARPPAKADLLLAGLRILVADDQDDSRDLIEFLLTQQGAVVTGAASAAEAFEIVRAILPTSCSPTSRCRTRPGTRSSGACARCPRARAERCPRRR